MFTAEQLRAARALIRWDQTDLAENAKVSVETVKRLEGLRGQVSGQLATIQAVKSAIEVAGVVFIPANGDGPGVRLRKDVD